MVRRCDLKSFPFNLISSVHKWSGAVIKAKPLDKPDLERKIFTQQFYLRYVAYCRPKSSYKSSSDMFLFKFPTCKVFNVFWELDSFLFCVRTFVWKISCSECGWFWQVLCSREKCCCICWLCRYCCCCCCGTFNFCNFSYVFSWFSPDVSKFRIVVCVSIK